MIAEREDVFFHFFPRLNNAFPGEPAADGNGWLGGEEKCFRHRCNQSARADRSGHAASRTLRSAALCPPSQVFLSFPKFLSGPDSNFVFDYVRNRVFLVLQKRERGMLGWVSAGTV